MPRHARLLLPALALLALGGCDTIARAAYDGDGPIDGNLILFPTYEIRLPAFDVTDPGRHEFVMNDVPRAEYYANLRHAGPVDRRDEAWERIVKADPEVRLRIFGANGNLVFEQQGRILGLWEPDQTGPEISDRMDRAERLGTWDPGSSPRYGIKLDAEAGGITLGDDESYKVEVHVDPADPGPVPVPLRVKLVGGGLTLK